MASHAPGDGTARQAIRLAAAVAAGVLALGITSWVLRVPEMDEVLAEARSRARKLLGT
jgi:hypothetical protein